MTYLKNHYAFEKVTNLIVSNCNHSFGGFIFNFDEMVDNIRKL